MTPKTHVQRQFTIINKTDIKNQINLKNINVKISDSKGSDNKVALITLYDMLYMTLITSFLLLLNKLLCRSNMAPKTDVQKYFTNINKIYIKKQINLKNNNVKMSDLKGSDNKVALIKLYDDLLYLFCEYGFWEVFAFINICNYEPEKQNLWKQGKK